MSVPLPILLGGLPPIRRLFADGTPGMALWFDTNQAFKTSGGGIVTPASILTVVRASAGSFFDSAGVLQQAANNALRLDYDPVTLAPLGVLIEVVRTNLALRCRDLTNAAWTKSNMTTAMTATGPDGVANSATTLTATGANATALQAIVSTSAARISSMFVKRRTGSGVVNITHDNGGTWTAVTVTAAWTRVSNPSTTATDPTVGVRIVTSGDEIDVDMFQHELGAFITSAIPTVASQVTRAADTISILTSAFPYSATAGAVMWSGERATAATGDLWMWSIDNGTSNHRLWNSLAPSTGNATMYVVDSGNFQVVDLNDGAPTAGTFFKTASAWTLNDFAFSRDGRSVVADGAGTLPTVGALRIGMTDQSLVQLNGHIKRLEYYATRETNAQLRALST